MKALTVRQARLLADQLGVSIDTETRTFYATNDAESELYEFESKAERDRFVRQTIEM